MSKHSERETHTKPYLVIFQLKTLVQTLVKLEPVILAQCGLLHAVLKPEAREQKQRVALVEDLKFFIIQHAVFVSESEIKILSE